jgi:hypothetical protein
VALRAVFSRHGYDPRIAWYYPTADEYRSRLEASGFHIDSIGLFPRPTPLPGGMDGWLRTFCVTQFQQLPAELVPVVERDIVDLLRPSLCDQSGRWTADYVRLRVSAHLTN